MGVFLLTAKQLHTQLHLTDSDTRIYFASVNMGDKKIKLTYFDLRARGEPCRLLLAYGGVKYEDERIPPPWDASGAWQKLKPNTPLVSCPSSTGREWRCVSPWPVLASSPER